MIITRPDFPAPVLVLDEFFSPAIAEKCLQECIDLRKAFQPASVGAGSSNRRDAKIRRNDVVMMDSVFSVDRSRSDILTSLHTRVHDRECNALWHKGYSLFDIINYATWQETVLSRYGTCDFYGPHQDTVFNPDRQADIVHRLVTIVVYLNQEPEAFTGGELTLFAEGQQQKFTPRHNRAIVFPSFVVHEVSNVRLDEKAGHAGGRFSINHWLGFQK